jgi:hypothetical protein
MSYEIDPNILREILDRIVATIDFTRPGAEGSLGKDIALVIVEEIRTRTVDNAQAADGSTLKENEPRYAARKRAKYGMDQPLLRTGQMLSQLSLLGQTTIGPQRIEMKYGLGVPPSSGSTGYIEDGDMKVTDREKAGWTEAERPFYALDDRIGDEVMTAIGEWLQKQQFD